MTHPSIQRRAGFALLLTGCLFATSAAWGQEKASEADAKKTLTAILDLIKAKGLQPGSDLINKGELAGCKIKDMGCGVYTTEAKVLVAPNSPAMIGQQFPDLMDIDGKPITGALLGPHKAGKTTWEASYKFTPPNAKVIVMRHAFCAKVDANTLACTTISQ